MMRRSLALMLSLQFLLFEPVWCVAPEIVAAIISGGATLLTSSGGNGGATYMLSDGSVVHPDNCWEDGSGPCPNANCLDGKGRKGKPIKESIVGCKWFCYHRSHCKTQICCSVGTSVATITTKTGAGYAAETYARVVLELCGSKGGCCRTSTRGRGLDNPGEDRRKGQTDVYTGTSILGNCAEPGILKGSPARATLTTSDPDGSDGWHVEWIEITMTTGEKFLCPFNAWLDNGAPGTPSAGPPSDPAGPPSATSICNQACSLFENTKFSGYNVYTTKGVKVANRAGCAELCFDDTNCNFWTYNPRVSKCWIKTSDEGRSPSTKGSVSGQKVCGAPVPAAESGSIQSDNHPNNYPNKQDKTYKISVSAGKKVKITFARFSLEYGSRCRYDYLTIVDGNGNTILGKSCGATKPRAVTSQTNKVKVIFHSDYSVTSTGFKINWTAV